MLWIGRLLFMIGGAYIGGKIFESLFPEKSDIPKRRIFISHSWRHSDEYDKVVEKLEENNIEILNHSIPPEKAFTGLSKTQLRNKFRQQMIYCSKVFVLAKYGIAMNSFVYDEIEIAQEMNKEIIAVKPHGQIGIPQYFQKNTNRIISNNIASIIICISDE